jgi:hypothetical protein
VPIDEQDVNFQSRGRHYDYGSERLYLCVVLRFSALAAGHGDDPREQANSDQARCHRAVFEAVQAYAVRAISDGRVRQIRCAVSRDLQAGTVRERNNGVLESWSDGSD